MDRDRQDSSAEISASNPAAPRRRPLMPGRWLWIILALLVVAIVVARLHLLIDDNGIANVTTWIASGVAGLVVIGWFVFRSGYPRGLRFGVLGLLVIAVAGFFTVFRIKQVDGELVPRFARRFARDADYAMTTTVKQSEPVDLSTTTPDDFPQFLGPGRDLRLTHLRLQTDLAAHPPRLLWRQKIGAGWSAFSAVNGYAVTMEQRGDEEMVTCYDVLTGQLRWAYSVPSRYVTVTGGVGPRATPTIDQGRVYTLGALGHLACLDGATGRCLWQKDLLVEYDSTPEQDLAAISWGRSASPLVVDGLVVVPVGGKKDGRPVSLAAFDHQTGQTVWESGTRQIGYSSPTLATLAGLRQILIVNEDAASGHDVKTGRLLWEHPWPGSSHGDANVSQPLPLPPDRVLLSKGYAAGAAVIRLTPEDDGTLRPEAVWQSRRVLRTKFTNIAVKGPYGFGLSDGVLECVDLSTGKSQWRDGRYRHGQILLVGDVLVVLSERGEVVLVEATSERANHVLGRFQVFDPSVSTWNNIALFGPYLLVRNSEEAACYQMAIESPSPSGRGPG